MPRGGQQRLRQGKNLSPSAQRLHAEKVQAWVNRAQERKGGVATGEDEVVCLLWCYIIDVLLFLLYANLDVPTFGALTDVP